MRLPTVTNVLPRRQTVSNLSLPFFHIVAQCVYCKVNRQLGARGRKTGLPIVKRLARDRSRIGRICGLTPCRTPGIRPSGRPTENQELLSLKLMIVEPTCGRQRSGHHRSNSKISLVASPTWGRNAPDLLRPTTNDVLLWWTDSTQKQGEL